MNNEQKHIIENTLSDALSLGQITRRQFMQGMIATGLGLSGAAILAACGAPAATPAPAATAAGPADTSTRGLTPTFYQWIIDLHPGVPDVNKTFAGLNFQIAPVAGFDVARFVAEGKNKQSTWDVYVGMTPFVEMAALIKADVIEPWDPYIPKDVLDDMIPSIRDECTVNGKLYSWPFLLDIIVQGYNVSITNKAGIPDKPPVDWDEYLANAKQVLDKGAAQYGCTFDAHGWRSLGPIAHSISTKCYYNLAGDASGVPLFDFTSDPAVQALQIMKKMLDLSSANALQPGTTDGGYHQAMNVTSGAQRISGGGRFMDVQVGSGTAQTPTSGGGGTVQTSSAIKRH